MGFARLGYLGRGSPVGVDQDRFVDLRSLPSKVTGDVLADDRVDRTMKALHAGRLPPLSGSDGLRIGAQSCARAQSCVSRRTRPLTLPNPDRRSSSEVIATCGWSDD